MKKRYIIIPAVIAALVVLGIFGYRLVITYVFDHYLLDATLSSVVKVDAPESETVSTPAEAEPKQTDGADAETENSDTSTAVQPQKKKLSKTEIARRILKSSELTHKMASIIPYQEKKQIISIVMSNFTADELSEIATNLSNGVDSSYKSKMMKEAQTRLTSAQWQQCINLAHKYLEQMRPYVE